jgi:hAT family C-terminal dimerisation region
MPLLTEVTTVPELVRLRNIIVHSRKSLNNITQFENILDGKEFYLATHVPWKSWYYWWTLLDVAVECSTSITEYANAHESALQDNILSTTDWNNLHAIKQFLIPFHGAWMELQMGGVRLETAVPALDVLNLSFHRLQNNVKASNALKLRAGAAQKVFRPFYDRMMNSSFYACSVVLHPQWRTNYIKNVWKKEWQEPALVAVRALWEDFRDATCVPLSPRSALKQSSTRKEEDEESEDEDKVRSSMFRQVVQDTITEVIGQAETDDLDRYFSEMPSEISGSAINWWSQENQRMRYPRLSIFAKWIFSIPAQSGVPRQRLSHNLDVVGWDEVYEEYHMAEATACLQSWLRTKSLSSWP